MKDLINLTGNLSFDEAKAIIDDYMSVLCVAEKGVLNYAAKSIDKQKHLQTNGRWNGVVWYSDEHGAKKRKSFCGTTKQEVKEKITEYLADFDRQLTASDESKAKPEESISRWLRVFKFPSLERGAYDRLECTAKHQIYPIIGNKVVEDTSSVDIKALLGHWMDRDYAYTMVKKVYNILTDYFRYLIQQNTFRRTRWPRLP